MFFANFPNINVILMQIGHFIQTNLAFIVTKTRESGNCIITYRLFTFIVIYDVFGATRSQRIQENQFNVLSSICFNSKLDLTKLIGTCFLYAIQ